MFFDVLAGSWSQLFERKLRRKRDRCHCGDFSDKTGSVKQCCIYREWQQTCHCIERACKKNRSHQLGSQSCYERIRNDLDSEPEEILCYHRQRQT